MGSDFYARDHKPRPVFHAYLSCILNFLAPAVFELSKASENIQNGSLLREYLLSSIIAVEIIIVTIYGFAVLLNVQWLRLGGIYGLFCVYFKIWLLLSSFLSTKQEDWGNVANAMLNYIINMYCLAIGPIAFRAWQWRSKAKINRSTYFVGIIISYNLFLVFSFLLNFVIFALSGALTIAVSGITFLIFSHICIVPYIVRKKPIKPKYRISFIY